MGCQGTRVAADDVIIGKTAPLPQDESGSVQQRFSKKDMSTCLKHSENGMVDQVGRGAPSDRGGGWGMTVMMKSEPEGWSDQGGNLST